MALRSRPRVLKHCAEGHTMEMLWRTCPQCTGVPPLMQSEPPELDDATRIIEPEPAAKPPVAPPPRSRSWALVVTDGIVPGERMELKGKGLRVGRAPSHAGGQELFQPPDTHLSRDHFAIVPDGDGWAIHDLGSTNGTRVNGEKVNRRALQAGDEIRAGHTSFRIEDGSGAGGA